jgi:hypothetical protein
LPKGCDSFDMIGLRFKTDCLRLLGKGFAPEVFALAPFAC